MLVYIRLPRVACIDGIIPPPDGTVVH